MISSITLQWPLTGRQSEFDIYLDILKFSKLLRLIQLIRLSTLTVYASEGEDDLKKVAGPVMNDPKVVAADNVLKGEWHLQLIKL